MAPTATDRLRRLLALVPWVAAHPDGVPIAEVCARFDIAPERLVADLETVMMVGVHPFTPDTLIDLWLDDDVVTVRYADSFTRPLRLTPAEAVDLVTSARALLAAPGPEPSGALSSALDKLAEALGPDALAAVDVTLAKADESVFQALDDGRRNERQVEIDYFSPGHGERRARRVEPARLWADDGRWYVAGWCHLAEDDRVFRLDRIARAVGTDEPFLHRRTDAPEALRFDDPNLPRVTLEVRTPSSWLFDQVPALERSTTADGGVRLRLAIASPTWLERLLLQLGPDVRVVEDDPRLAAASAARDAARRLLTRYEDR